MNCGYNQHKKQQQPNRHEVADEKRVVDDPVVIRRESADEDHADQAEQDAAPGDGGGFSIFDLQFAIGVRLLLFFLKPQK